MSNLPPPPPPPPPGRSSGSRGSGQQSPERRPGRTGPGLPRWSLWVLVGVLVLLVLGPRLIPEEAGTDIAYNQFIELVRDGKVRDISYNNNTLEITGTQTNNQEFATVAPAPGISETDLALIDGSGAEFKPKTPTSNWVTSLIPLLLPFLLIVGLFVWMQRRAAGQMGNVMSIGRSRAKAYTTDRPSTTFADVAGYEGVKHEINEVVDFLRMPERFKEIGARVPKGILLVGPPGTGKTLFARAVAGEAGVGFLSVTGSDFMEMFVGVGASRVRDLFQQARKMGRAIIFIDEIDSIGRKRGAGLGGGHDEREQTLNQMLAEMDGFETSEGIVIMAATNRPDILDPALLRPGRFDRDDRRPPAGVRRAPGDPQGPQPGQADGTRHRSRRDGQGHTGNEPVPTSPTWSTRPPWSPCDAARRWSSGSTSRTPVIGW